MKKVFFVYIAGEVVKSWAVGTFFYIVWGMLIEGKKDAMFAVLMLISQPLAMLAFSLYLSKIADKINALERAILSILLRVFAILCIFFAFSDLVETGEFSVSLVLFAILFSIIIALDGIFHSPMAFIAAKRAEINLVRFRVSQALLIKGANVITPTLALFFIENVVFALYILAFCLLLSLSSSGILSMVEKPKRMQNISFKILEYQKKIVLIYAFLMFRNL